jgi:hypothetical protein
MCRNSEGGTLRAYVPPHTLSAGSVVRHYLGHPTMYLAVLYSGPYMKNVFLRIYL